MGAIEGQPILNSQDWEQIRRGGNAAIEKWIDDQMKWKSAVIVLIGKETASRPWVKYEIEKAWNIKKPLLGIYIHGLSSMGKVDSKGANPLASHGIQPFDPTQTDWLSGKIDSKATYNYLKDHLKMWATQGKTRLW
ncbi:MAG: TIR domain-containing protein [Bifidobacterium crudilactis]|nr:TIR domain-containing protein [Bifidobacterium crudilactis]